MVRRWDQWKDPWDREYAKRGRLWRGSASVDPLPGMRPAPARVVEVGCGDGKFLRALWAAGYDAVGIDSSRRGVRLAAQGSRDRLLQGDVRSLPVRSASCGVVVARYVMGALRESDRRRAARELSRILAPGGLLMVQDFSTSDFRHGRGAPVEPNTFERNQGILTHYFVEGEIESLFPGLAVQGSEPVLGRIQIRGETHRRASLRVVFVREA